MAAHGKIYVGKYVGNKLPPMPPNTVSILIHTSDKNLGGGLSPYQLRYQGMLLENIWQFSKLYQEVTAQRTPVSRFHPDRIVWEHPAEVHVDANRQITPAYWAWRRKGYANPYAVRYPNGFHGRGKCICSIWPDATGTYQYLDYITARKKIYCALYEALAPKHPHFVKLQQMLQAGQNICLVEVDGPNVDWYRESPIQDRIEGSVLRVDPLMITYLLNDPTHPFGHGYAIAALLAGMSFSQL